MSLEYPKHRHEVPETDRVVNKDEARFDAEAKLKGILKLSRNDRPEALRDWKQQHLEQRTGLAQMQNQVITLIRENPDRPKEELLELVERAAQEFALETKQEKIAVRAVEMFSEIRANIRSVKERYPDDRELFEKIFGIRPIGKVQIVAGPITMTVVCSSRIDHARILAPEKNTWSVLKQLVLKGGIVGSYIGDMPNAAALLPELEGVLTTQRVPLGPGKDGDVRLHEEQHKLRRLLQDAATHSEIMESVTEREISDESTSEHILSECRDYIEAAVEDELLAMIKDGTSPREFLPGINTLYINKFVYQEKNRLECDREEAVRILSQHAADPDKLLHAQSIFNGAIARLNSRDFRMELAERLYEAWTGYSILQKRGKFNDEEVIAMLQFEPLSQWRKVAERVIRQKEGLSRLESLSGPAD